ncbi:MAG: hypothetical protein SOZ62_05485 [Eubacteriales bacterium]|nr:hypothetical protein [Eubacteriales bacterium]
MRANKIPDDIDKIIAAVCHDYKRRKNLIEGGHVNGDVRAHYIKMNSALESALDEECEAGLRKDMLDDIAIRRGYRKTPAYYVSQVTYYDRKRRVKYAIAKKLHLL